MSYFKLAVSYLQIVIVLLNFDTVESVGKVVDINGDLPKLVDEHPDKSWLVEFYAPWCYHCQQLELTYNNVAEKIYQTQSNLVVGRVDCTKHGRICERYDVDSYPTIIHINKDTSAKYKGDRSEASIVDFAERLQGPNVKTVHDCNGLKEATKKHGLVVLSTISNASNQLKLEFESLARAHKSNYWFYTYLGHCDKYIREEGLYLLKKHLGRAIRFTMNENAASAGQDINLKDAIIDWLNKESFPVYGQINYGNIEKTLNTNKMLAIAVLEEYKPARSFTRSSLEFHRNFEKFARNYAQHDDQILFVWSSDRELVEYITITSVEIPNLILLKPDFSYHLLVKQSQGNNGAKENENVMPDKLNNHRIRSVLDAAKEGRLIFSGGNSFLIMLMRRSMANINRFLNMYRANPLLVSLLFGFPGVIIVFVIYTTCFYEGQDGEDEALSDEGDEDVDDEDHNERQPLTRNGHLKQD